jgi:putative hydrolase of the HAD superfamily
MYTDSIDTLGTVRSRGPKVGLMSNTIWPGLLNGEDLEHFDILDFFDHLLFSADVGVCKSHPQIFKTALGALQVTPHDAAFVGDRVPEDVAVAQRVGMRGVWKERSERDRLPGVIPDAQMVHLRELLDILNIWTERDDA